MKQYLKCLILASMVALVAVFPSVQAKSTDSLPKKPQEPKITSKKNLQVLRPKHVKTAKTTPACGPANPGKVLNLILAQGVPQPAAIQILGSWRSESHLNPCQNNGDGGIAHGLNSWHPGRRHDMPLELSAQVRWAIKTEMPRDCRKCYETVMNPDSTTEQIRSAIKASTRWGVQGNRWHYADQFAKMFSPRH